MEYRTLPPEVLTRLRVERLQELEAAHFRVLLRGEEASPGTEESAAVAAEADDLFRRIELHLAVLPAPAPDEPEHNADAAPDPL